MIHKMINTMKPSKPPREWEGVGEAGGGAFPRKERSERSEGGGVSEANGVYYIWSILLSIYCHRSYVIGLDLDQSTIRTIRAISNLLCVTLDLCKKLNRLV